MSQSPKKIIFVTGKGGVGKSTIALAVAHKLAQQGHRTLLVEMGERSFFKSFLRLNQVGYVPQTIHSNLDLALFDAKGALKEYVGFYLRVKKVYNIFFENKVIQEIIQSAPSLKELALLGKITAGPRNIGPAIEYDYLVIDSFSTGHHRALIQTPQSLGDVFPNSSMGHQCREMTDVLKDQGMVKTILVTTAEELPVIETLEFYQYLKNNWHEPWVCCNKRTLVSVENTQGVTAKLSRVLQHIQHKKQEEKIYFEKLKQVVPQVNSVPEYLSLFGMELAEKVAEEISHEEII